MYNSADFGRPYGHPASNVFPFLGGLEINDPNGILSSVLLIHSIKNLDLTVCAPLSSIGVSDRDGLSDHEKRSNENEAD